MMPAGRSRQHDPVRLTGCCGGEAASAVSVTAVHVRVEAAVERSSPPAFSPARKILIGFFSSRPSERPSVRAGGVTVGSTGCEPDSVAEGEGGRFMRAPHLGSGKGDRGRQGSRPMVSFASRSPVSFGPKARSHVIPRGLQSVLQKVLHRRRDRLAGCPECRSADPAWTARGSRQV